MSDKELCWGHCSLDEGLGLGLGGDVPEPHFKCRTRPKSSRPRPIPSDHCVLNQCSELLTHLNSHGSSDIHECSVCHCRFDNKHAYNDHINAKLCMAINDSLTTPRPTKDLGTGLDRKKWQCSQCNAVFKGHRHLIKHMEGHKNNDCKLCDKPISTRKHHIVHMQTAHNTVEGLYSEKFSCEHCNEGFAKRLKLFRHYEKLHARKLNLVVCMICGEFLKKEDVKPHEIKHETERPWKCKICYQSFSRKQQYCFHMKAHDKYKCDVCKLNFSLKSKFLEHDLKVHQRQPVDQMHACQLCSMTFPRPGLLDQHYRTHSGEQPFHCKICNKNFTTHKSFKKHMNSTHQNLNTDSSTKRGNKETFTCDKCTKSYRTKMGLIRHLAKSHEHGCKFCSFKTNSIENAKRHMSFHIDERKFVCEHCGSAFFTLSNLQDHFQYVHTSERRFSCDQCKAAFKTNSSLKRHLRTHSNLRPYGCHCGQTYKRVSHLQRHQNAIHGPLKPKRLQRLRPNESGHLVPVEEKRKIKVEKKQKITSKLQTESSNDNPTTPTFLSLFLADTGQIYALQPVGLAPLNVPHLPTSAHDNVVISSGESKLLPMLQMNHKEDILTDVSVNLPSLLKTNVFTTSNKTIVQQFSRSTTNESVESSLLETLQPTDSFFPNDYGRRSK